MNNPILFISGSCSVVSLPDYTKKYLSDICRSDAKIIIGDAHGTDTVVQEYLFSIGARNVEIYYNTIECRANVGSWNAHKVPEEKYHDECTEEWTEHVSKDIEMSHICTHALVIWDGHSSATRKNIERVASMNKEVTVLYADIDCVEVRYDTVLGERLAADGVNFWKIYLGDLLGRFKGE